MRDFVREEVRRREHSIANDALEALLDAVGEDVDPAGELEQAVDTALAANPSQVQQYRDGKTKVLGFLVGQVMKASGGKANPRQVSALIKGKLDEN